MKKLAREGPGLPGVGHGDSRPTTSRRGSARRHVEAPAPKNLIVHILDEGTQGTLTVCGVGVDHLLPGHGVVREALANDPLTICLTCEKVLAIRRAA